MRHHDRNRDDKVGVPEALPRTLESVGRRLGTEAIDRLWIFPPLVKGRREWGLVAASCFDVQDTRRVITARYSAERTGKGLFLDAQMAEEGSAPHDRLPRVMDGVVARSQLPTGSPRVVELAGGAEAWAELLDEYDAALFEEAVVGPPQAN
ncbi:MAG: hypothetical protein HKO53_07560 [Gemmatimonadetes bacterium]|nr:hypothetical protein [Gemmatimonadota bacterium]